jgi:hypothetical protein
MGNVQGTLFSPNFNHFVVVKAGPERLISHAGALLIPTLPCLPAHIRRSGAPFRGCGVIVVIVTESVAFVLLMRGVGACRARGASAHQDVGVIEDKPAERLTRRRGRLRSGTSVRSYARP